MADPDYIIVRRPKNTTFRVLPGDLIAGTPRGYDLTLMRSLTLHGLVTPICVRPVPGGLFEVVNGEKRLAAIQMLVQMNKLVYDRLRGFARPAKQVYALVRCSL